LLVLEAIDPTGNFFVDADAESNDTKVLRNALQLKNGLADVQDAGTAMRFATAFHALHTEPGQRRTLMGTPRMHQRPIGPLVDALRSLGADITYLGQEGYPPLSFGPYKHNGVAAVSIDTSLSSQFATALLLVAPALPKGLSIQLEGDTVSASYIQLTVHMMRQNGLIVTDQDRTLAVASIYAQGNQFPRNRSGVSPESDWSAAGYFFSFTGITGIPILLQNLNPESYQGDRAALNLFAKMGVRFSWDKLAEGTLLCEQTEVETKELEVDFTLLPDQAQTLVVYAAARGISLRAKGLSTLRIKETDRIAALQTELAKIGCGFTEIKPGVFQVYPEIGLQPEIGVQKEIGPADSPTFATYHDHRMAMSFAPLAGSFRSVKIEGAECVAKSFPSFWQQVSKLYIDAEPLALISL